MALRLKHTAFVDPSHLTLPVQSTFSEGYFLPTNKMGVNTPVTLLLDAMEVGASGAGGQCFILGTLGVYFLT